MDGPNAMVFGDPECKEDTYRVGDEPDEQPSGRELLEAYGQTKSLRFCGGREVLAKLGWTERQQLRVRFQPGEHVVYRRCAYASPRVVLEFGTATLEAQGSQPLTSQADLEAQLDTPRSALVLAADFRSQCGLQLALSTANNRIEACLSAQVAPGQLRYASFRADCSVP